MSRGEDHPNVVCLIGVVTKFDNAMLVLQICDNGSLHSLLIANSFHPEVDQRDGHRYRKRTSGYSMTNKSALRIANDVAKGMNYLSKRQFVHRDVAARNILVAADWICRVADFGLSRKLAQKDYYYIRSSSHDPFPLRWSAPEVVSLGHFSSKADVWCVLVCACVRVCVCARVRVCVCVRACVRACVALHLPII